MLISRYFTDGKTEPLEVVEWVDRIAELQGGHGKMQVQAPAFWSDTAVNVFASHYLRVVAGHKETSIRQAIERVAGTFASWACDDGYLSLEDSVVFREELEHVLVHQMWSPNSPVWYNIGCKDRPQLSACFIQSVTDSMDGEQGIIQLQVSETNLFRRGSGTGTNLSSLRYREAKLSTGGTASGPTSFMRALDAWAGVTKSGGTTRRAAKMWVLNVDHPDIFDYVRDKAEAERMASALIDAGWPADYNGKVYTWLPFQNANNSVRVTDAFMLAVRNDSAWPLRWQGEVVREVRARDLWHEVCEAAHVCGDPGIQFDDANNTWHTSPGGGRINASNPCQPAFAPVLTPAGIRTIGNVRVGDTVWSGSHWTRVTAKVSTGTKMVRCYQTTAGSFMGTDEHRVIQRGERVEVKDAESIDVCVGPLTDPDDPIHDQDVVDGWVFGDGSVHGASDDLVYLYLGQGDIDIFTDKLGCFIVRKRPGLGQYAWEVKTTITASELPRTYDRRVPGRFYRGSAAKVRGFLKGLYAANGSVCGGRVTLKATSFEVIAAVQEMLSSIGIRSYFTTNKPSRIQFANGEYECRESYDLNITHGRWDFARLIGFVHPSKAAKLASACAGARGSRVKDAYEVVSISDMGEMEVFDITVEAEEHTYWTGGLLVSNCSEFVFLDDSACNLASKNLRKFKRPGEPFDVAGFRAAVRLSILAQEVAVGRASYPTPAIERNSLRYRPLGLGYSNLGALLMADGVPYDSEEGRDAAAAITALMTACAYEMSQDIARVVGEYEGASDPANAEGMHRVLHMHHDAMVDPAVYYTHMSEAHEAACNIMRGVINSPTLPRNAQVTLLAPTGTISFGMDCDTTGIEPDFALVKHKRMAGGGWLKIANNTVSDALASLGYDEEARRQILAYVAEREKIEGCPALAPEHLPVFDCAVQCGLTTGSPGERCLAPDAHILMMAAVQPFLSGAISKTVNVPYRSSVEDISRLYTLAWEHGLKCVAVYRDGCKRSQPLDTGDRDAIRWEHPQVRRALAHLAGLLGVAEFDGAEDLVRKTAQLRRRKLPDERRSVTRKFSIAGHDGYLHVGLHEDGTPGELFVRMSKEGSTISGLLDAWATTFSIALQYGAPLAKLCEKGMGTSFSPAGFTGDDLRSARSVVDYICTYLHRKFVEGCETNGAMGGGGVAHNSDSVAAGTIKNAHVDPVFFAKAGGIEGPPCDAAGCGGTTRRAGSCYVCERCGSTTGCG